MNALRKRWWIAALQGLFLIVLGLLSVLSSGFDLRDLVQFLGLILLVFGATLGLGAILAGRSGKSWFAGFALGAVQLILGLLIISYVSSSVWIFTVIIGSWAVLMGLFQFITAFRVDQNRIFFLINGALSLVFGGLIIFNPFNSNETLTYLVGFYSLLLGIFIVYYSFIFRRIPVKTSSEELKDEDQAPNLRNSSDS